MAVRIKDNLTRQNDFVERQKAKGLQLIRIWVPAEQVEKFKASAKRSCDRHETKKGKK